MVDPTQQMLLFLALNLALPAFALAGGFLAVRSTSAHAFLYLLLWHLSFMVAAGSNIQGAPLPSYWMSSLQQLVVCCAAFFLLRFRGDEIGLILPSDRIAWLWCAVLFVAAMVFGATAALLERHQHFTPQHMVVGRDYLVWRALMPGITEELAYRGLFLALLQRGISEEHKRNGLIMAGVITTLLFSALHMMVFDGPEWVAVNVGRVGYAFVMGALLLLVRRKTGSLFAGMVIHNAANIAGTLV